MSSSIRTDLRLAGLCAGLLLACAADALAQTPEIPITEPPPPTSSPQPPDVGAGPAAAEETAPAAAAGSEPALTAAETPSSDGDARLAPSLSGEAGLLRIPSALGPEPGALRLSLGIDFFSAGSMFQEGDLSSRVGAILGISGAPVEHLELWLNLRAQSSRSTESSPELLQALGDLRLGAKGHYAFSDGAYVVGADLQLGFLTGVGSQTFDFGATQFQIRALFSTDLMKTSLEVPVRTHVNFGGIVDSSGSLIEQQITDAERFAYGASDFDRLLFGFGIEVPVKYVTPFLEYSMELPLGYLATPGVAVIAAPRNPGAQAAGLRAAQGVGESLATDAARPALPRVIPQRLTPGVRVTAIPDLTIDFAVEIGLTPDAAPGVVAVPPYNVIFLFSYALDPFRDRGVVGPPIAVPILVQEETEPATGLLTGVVLNGEDKKPLEGVVVSFDRAPPVATSENGRFLSHEIEPGPVKMTARKDGFEPATSDVQVQVGQTQDLKVTLAPSVRDGTLRGRLTDAQGKPVAGASLTFDGPKQERATSGGDGAYKVELPEGQYKLVVEGSSVYRAERSVRVEKRKEATLDLSLKTRITPPLAEVAGKRFKLRRRFAFTKDDALTKESLEIVDAIADLMLTQPGLRLKIEAHTDNSIAEADANRKTQAQAEAIASALTAQGVGADRVAAVGVGSARPIAPNLTQRGRDQNRRVDLTIPD
ncbi:MAG: OmpA family protein [Deltaproteobacteria bacterium]|nr:OmpA family protein [Deltaproteobacteria bacterium]